MTPEQFAGLVAPFEAMIRAQVIENHNLRVQCEQLAGEVERLRAQLQRHDEAVAPTPAGGEG